MATAVEPPSLEIFDFASHQKTISQRTKQTEPSVVPTGDSDLVRVLDFLSLSFGSPQKPLLPPFHPQSTPAATSFTTIPSSMLAPHLEPTPSDFGLFFDYATEHHGIESSSYCNLLLAERVGPDIIGDMEMSELAEYRIAWGDVHRLKHAARDWSAGEAEAWKKQNQGTVSVSEQPLFELNLLKLLH
jgi:hypothetical protein